MLRSLWTIALILFFQCATLLAGLAILVTVGQVLAFLDLRELAYAVWGLGFPLLIPLSFALTVRLVHWLGPRNPEIRPEPKPSEPPACRPTR